MRIWKLRSTSAVREKDPDERVTLSIVLKNSSCAL